MIWNCFWFCNGILFLIRLFWIKLLFSKLLLYCGLNEWYDWNDWFKLLLNPKLLLYKFGLLKLFELLYFDGNKPLDIYNLFKKGQQNRSKMNRGLFHTK